MSLTVIIEICYFAPINSTFYKKNNLDKKCPYNNLEQDIYNLKNEGNILLETLMLRLQINKLFF